MHKSFACCLVISPLMKSLNSLFDFLATTISLSCVAKSSGSYLKSADIIIEKGRFMIKNRSQKRGLNKIEDL